MDNSIKDTLRGVVAGMLILEALNGLVKYVNREKKVGVKEKKAWVETVDKIVHRFVDSTYGENSDHKYFEIWDKVAVKLRDEGDKAYKVHPETFVGKILLSLE